MASLCMDLLCCYHISCLLLLIRACLAATIRSSGASQSTIKLVATNLIANSKLMGERNILIILTLIMLTSVAMRFQGYLFSFYLLMCFVHFPYRGSAVAVSDRQRSGCLSLPSDVWWMAALGVAGQVNAGWERRQWGVLEVGWPSHLCWSQPKGKSLNW